MDTIKVKFLDDPKYERKLPDISYERFMELMNWSGASDLAYAKYLRKNGMVELEDYNKESTSNIVLEFEETFSGRMLKFKCFYDSDNE